MRILFDHQAFSLQVTGGITRYYYEVIRRLNRTAGISADLQLGFCTTIWPVREACGSQGKLTHWGKRPVPSGVGTYLLNELALNPLGLVSPPADIYHNTLYRFMPGIRARRYVATHHDCTIERFPHLFRESSLVIAAKKRMLRKADLVFCITESCRNDLLEFYSLDPSRTVVLTNGSEPLPQSQSAAQSLRAAVKRPFVLYVGTRFAYKNFSGLLKAFARSGLQRHYDLLAVGGGAFTNDEMREVRELGLGQALVSIPLASPELLGESYAAASLFVYPSLYEGLGLPPLEAMEKGCPVLASANPASLEVCRNAALFFDPASGDDFVEKLRLGLEDASGRSERIENGYTVCKLYSWDTVVAGMIDSYRALL